MRWGEHGSEIVGKRLDGLNSMWYGLEGARCYIANRGKMVGVEVRKVFYLGSGKLDF